MSRHRQAKQRAIANLYNDSESDEEVDLTDASASYVFDDAAGGDEADDLPTNDNDFVDELVDDNVLWNIEESSDDSDSEDSHLGTSRENFVSASGKVWIRLLESGSNLGRRSARNVVFQGGDHLTVKREIKPEKEEDYILMYIQHIVDEAVIYTNLAGRRMITMYNNDHSAKKTWKPVDQIEMEAFIGIHILSGFYKDQFRSTEQLWSEVDGLPCYRATFSRERFIQLKSCFRVDDPLRRDVNDPLAPVRHVFEHFIALLRSFVQPSSYLTVDEQLVEFHGRVKFRQYIGSKPGKFGMKIFWVCDNDGGYCLNGIVYIGANTVDSETLDESQSVPEAVVMTLMRPFFGSNCNLTGDNWFSSSALVDRLYENRITYVGTVRSNRRDVPPAARSIEKRVRGDTRLYHDGNNQILCSYWDKGRNPVLLVDSFTDRCSLPEEGRKPDTVLFYNATKSAVDDMDKKVRMYSTKRKCRRWPYSFIMNLIDIAGINGAILYGKNHELKQSDLNKLHGSFLKAAGYQLLDKHLRRRCATNTLNRRITVALSQLGYDRDERRNQEVITLERRKRCLMCPRNSDKKTIYSCANCQKPMCHSHRASVCKDCCS